MSNDITTSKDTMKSIQIDVINMNARLDERATIKMMDTKVSREYFESTCNTLLSDMRENKQSIVI
jgi:hypothetical protein